MAERVILHCDLNSFFASVELLDKPTLRDVPVAVCGDPKSRHGIILAKNEPAKKMGVKTAETLWQARKKCPALVLLPPHHRLYEEYSRRVNEIYDRFTDLVEPFGIDESWLDVTGSLHLFGGDGKALADRIRATIREETGLTVSVGVSFNKVFAKLGSDMKKPDATTVIPAEGWQSMVWPLPLGDMLFAGRTATETLRKYGIETVGQLAACDPALPEQLLGKTGLQLWQYANGMDKSPVKPRHAAEPVKSVGNGTTFPQNLVRWEQLRAGLLFCYAQKRTLDTMQIVGRRVHIQGIDNGITEAVILDEVRIKLFQHSERDGLLRATLLVQNTSRYDVEIPSIQYQRVGSLAHSLGVEAEHIHVGLPFDLLSITADGVPSSRWPDAELDVGQPAIALLPCLKICAALDLDAHFIAGLAITYPVVGERDVVGSPVIVGSAQINAQRGGYNELAVGASQGVVEQV